MFISMRSKTLNCALEKMTPASVGRAADMLRTLAHPARLRIVDVLNTTGSLPVSQITDYLGLTQSATSQHLNQMRRVGLLKTERRGKEAWYSIGDGRAVGLLNFLCSCHEKNR